MQNFLATAARESALLSTPRALNSFANLKEKRPAALAARVATVPVMDNDVAAAVNVAIKPPALKARPGPALTDKNQSRNQGWCLK